ncbi:MAG: glycosyltransferase family 4 protein [Lachnospiraceae bacterium]|jgi:glycosyltransferase involved in cell wall biosynthesis|nr:glycosyltransferase family 4 protein [Lachnospiraceae bacterium]
MVNAIYLTSRIYPMNNGGTLHDYGNCTFLSGLLRLTVFSCLDPSADRAAAQARFRDEPFASEFCTRPDRAHSMEYVRARLRLIEPVDTDLYRRIEQLAERERTGIVFFTLKMSLYAEKLKAAHPALHLICISHNSEYVNIRDDLKKYDTSRGTGRLRHFSKMLRARFFEAQEKKALSESDFVFSISENDSRRLSSHYGIPAARFVTCKPMIRFHSPRGDADSRTYRHSLLIVGNMNWYPTAAGAVRFAKEIFPALLAEDPQLRLYIVGANPAPEVQALAGGGADSPVIVTGFVQDVDEYYEKCDIAVVPVLTGTGAKIKVLEALGKHIPAVLTAYAAEDYPGSETCAHVAPAFADLLPQTLSLMREEAERIRTERAEEQYYREYMSDSASVRACIRRITEAADE